MFPRWLGPALIVIAVIWLIVDPVGFAAILKGLINSGITFMKSLG